MKLLHQQGPEYYQWNSPCQNIWSVNTYVIGYFYDNPDMTSYCISQYNLAMTNGRIDRIDTNNLKTFETQHTLVSKTILPTTYIKPMLSLHAFLDGIAIYIHAVLKIRTICYACDLWKLAQCHKQLHSRCPPDLWNLLSYSEDFKAPWNKTVLCKYSFMWNKGPVNIWNDCKAQG